MTSPAGRPGRIDSGLSPTPPAQRRQHHWQMSHFPCQRTDHTAFHSVRDSPHRGEHRDADSTLKSRLRSCQASLMSTVPRLCSLKEQEKHSSAPHAADDDSSAPSLQGRDKAQHVLCEETSPLQAPRWPHLTYAAGLNGPPAKCQALGFRSLGRNFETRTETRQTKFLSSDLRAVGPTRPRCLCPGEHEEPGTGPLQESL